MKTKILLFLALASSLCAQVAAPVAVEKKTETITVKTVVALVRVEVIAETDKPMVVGVFQVRYVTEEGKVLGAAETIYVRRELGGIVAQKAGVQTAVNNLTAFLGAARLEDEDAAAARVRAAEDTVALGK